MVSALGSTMGPSLTLYNRHRICAAVGLQVVDFCRPAHHLGLHQRHPILLAEPRRPAKGRPVPPEQLAW
jgi:hypothetical protein